MIHLPLWAFLALLFFAIFGFSLWAGLAMGLVLNLDRHLRTQQLMRDRHLQHAGYRDGGEEL